MTKTAFAAPLHPPVRHLQPVRPNGNGFPRRIMVDAEPTTDSEAPVSVAAALAAGTGAELVLLGIAAVAAQPPDDTDNPLDRTHAAAHWPDQQLLDDLTRQRVQRVAARLPGQVRVRVVVDWGGRTGGLLHAIGVEHPDLIVVPGPRPGRLRGLRDHDIRRVLHHAVVPVLVVPVQP